MELSFPSYLILFVSGLLAGFVDAIAGGGGLIALPALLSVGLLPQLALGTNKFQGSFGTLSAAANFIRKGKVKLSDNMTGIAFTFIGIFNH
nr:TSUP family transporter [uncultured Desulfobacter sp.]